MKKMLAIGVGLLVGGASAWAYGPYVGYGPYRAAPFYACRGPVARVGCYAPPAMVYAAPAVCAPSVFYAPPAVSVGVSVPRFTPWRHGGWHRR